MLSRDNWSFPGAGDELAFFGAMDGTASGRRGRLEEGVEEIIGLRIGYGQPLNQFAGNAVSG